MSESLKLVVKEDGTIWLVANVSDGRGGLLSINNIINDMNPEGITIGIFQDAAAEYIEDNPHG